MEVTESVEILLDPTINPLRLTVGGIGLGDPVSGIAREFVVHGHSPSVPIVQRTYGPEDEMSIQRPGEPALRPYPLAEIFDDACTYGGWVDLALPGKPRSHGTVRLDITDGRVTDMHLSGSWLAPLGLDSKAEIARLFGHNDRYHRTNSKTIWAWTRRSFAISWNDEDDRLRSLSLGPRVCASIPIFDAKSLIHWALTWRRNHPEDDWPLRPHPDSVAEPVIAGRIAALMKALDVHGETPSLERLFSGDFLQGSTRRSWDALLPYITGTGHDGPRHARNHRDQFMHSGGIPVLWTRMLQLRLHIEQITAFNEHIMVASGIYFYAVQLADDVGKRVEAGRDHIDQVLSLILDPAQRRFTWGYLVREHGFPDVDLDALEFEDLC